MMMGTYSEQHASNHGKLFTTSTSAPAEPPPHATSMTSPKNSKPLFPHQPYTPTTSQLLFPVTRHPSSVTRHPIATMTIRCIGPPHPQHRAGVPGCIGAGHTYLTLQLQSHTSLTPRLQSHTPCSEARPSTPSLGYAGAPVSCQLPSVPCPCLPRVAVRWHGTQCPCGSTRPPTGSASRPACNRQGAGGEVFVGVRLGMLHSLHAAAGEGGQRRGRGGQRVQPHLRG